uniref:Uncharacterized protein n=1 Tax=Pyxicephalus adspersus TaxID=30357 RepID=A0AAV2ZM78_PYXAD|nr:TPA: hypothetical protein GDO54_005642 [Pyxicephalus adspersus]
MSKNTSVEHILPMKATRGQQCLLPAGNKTPLHFRGTIIYANTMKQLYKQQSSQNRFIYQVSTKCRSSWQPITSHFKECRLIIGCHGLQYFAAWSLSYKVTEHVCIMILLHTDTLVKNGKQKD